VEKIKTTFQLVDRHMYDNDGLFGCTANIILVLDDNVYQINLGDSKSIIYTGNVILSQTIDHKPNNEKERILAKGAMVEKNRVNGMLAMSRAFGDYQLKLVNNVYDAEGPVSCIPDVIVTKRMPGTKFIVATDGLYDGIKEDVQYLTNMMSKHHSHHKMVKYLAYFVLGNNDDDDTTIISGNL
jgi:protein phosphatase 2C family protein 2/3